MNNTLKIPPCKQSQLTNKVLSFLCIDRDPHIILFYFCNCPLFNIWTYRRESIYITLENKMPIFPLFLLNNFLIFFSVPKHFPNWKIRKYFHWIKVNPVLKQLAWIQPEPIFLNFISTLGQQLSPAHSLISADSSWIPITIYLCPQAFTSPFPWYACT